MTEVAKARVALQSLRSQAEYAVNEARRGEIALRAATEASRAGWTSRCSKIAETKKQIKCDYDALTEVRAVLDTLPEATRSQPTIGATIALLERDAETAKHALAQAQAEYADVRQQTIVAQTKCRTRMVAQKTCVTRAEQALADIQGRIDEIVAVRPAPPVQQPAPLDRGPLRLEMRPDLPKGKCPGCGVVEGRSDHKLNRCTFYRAALDWAKDNMTAEGKAALAAAAAAGGEGEEDDGTGRRLCHFCGVGNGAAHGRVGKECALRLQSLWHAGAPTIVQIGGGGAAAEKPVLQQLNVSGGLGKGKGRELFVQPSSSADDMPWFDTIVVNARWQPDDDDDKCHNRPRHRG